MRASPRDVVVQLRAFSGELNGIALIHAGADRAELARLSSSADEIAGHIGETVSDDTAQSLIGLANRVHSMADHNRDATCAARLSVAASVLSTFARRD